MEQYRHIFSSGRNPGKNVDQNYEPSSSTTADFIVVLLKNQVYKIKAIHDKGERASDLELERQLYMIGQEALANLHEPSVSFLTSLPRNEWDDLQSSLKSLSAKNKANFDTINEALFVVSLDDFSMKPDVSNTATQLYVSKNGKNRWFDKTNIVITSAGRVGATLETSQVDPDVFGNMMDYVYEKYAISLPFF